MAILQWVNGANILILAPYSWPSHTNFVKPIVQELARRGHSITFWNGIRQKEQVLTNVTYLFSGEIRPYKNSIDHFAMSSRNPVDLLLSFVDRYEKVCSEIYKNEIFHYLMKSDQLFDVVIVEAFVNECVLTLWLIISRHRSYI